MDPFILSVGVPVVLPAVSAVHPTLRHTRWNPVLSVRIQESCEIYRRVEPLSLRRPRGCHTRVPLPGPLGDFPILTNCMHPEVWFIVEIPMGIAKSRPDVLSVTEVVRATGRSRTAVLAAVRAGRIRRATPDSEQATGQEVRVQATREDLQRWKRPSLVSLLSAHPDLPQSPEEWFSIGGAAQRWRVSYNTAQKRLRGSRFLRLQWGEGTPFRPEIWYWIPPDDSSMRAVCNESANQRIQS